MPDTEIKPITDQEIPVMADRIARGLVTYLLTEARDFLGGAIDESIGDDQDAPRLDAHTRGLVYGLVWDQLGHAATEYQRQWTQDTLPAASRPSGDR